MNAVQKITADQIRTDLPEFGAGDNITVSYKIVEGNKAAFAFPSQSIYIEKK